VWQEQPISGLSQTILAFYPLLPLMNRVELLESTNQDNFKDKDSTQALGSWKEYEAFRFPFPMHQAALMNDCDAVAEYLHSKHGCYRIDINALDSCGRTITHICAMESHLLLLLFIIDRRPNLEIRDCDVRRLSYYLHFHFYSSLFQENWHYFFI
jgi:ankyrin repeat protein